MPCDQDQVSLPYSVLEERDDPASQLVRVSLERYALIIDGEEYRIAANPGLISRGSHLVVEKWEHPYWRRSGWLFYPHPENPIGQYLVILSRTDQDEKVGSSIHRWPLSLLHAEPFEQGPHGNGCIRTDPAETAKIFEAIELGALVDIK